MAVSVKTVATRTSNVITLTKQNVKPKPINQKLMKFNARMSPEQVEVETELDCSVLKEQLYSAGFNL